LVGRPTEPRTIIVRGSCPPGVRFALFATAQTARRFGLRTCVQLRMVGHCLHDVTIISEASDSRTCIMCSDSCGETVSHALVATITITRELLHRPWVSKALSPPSSPSPRPTFIGSNGAESDEGKVRYGSRNDRKDPGPETAEERYENRQGFRTRPKSEKARWCKGHQSRIDTAEEVIVDTDARKGAISRSLFFKASSETRVFPRRG
jgi:hypothetical protein